MQKRASARYNYFVYGLYIEPLPSPPISLIGGVIQFQFKVVLHLSHLPTLGESVSRESVCTVFRER